LIASLCLTFLHLLENLMVRKRKMVRRKMGRRRRKMGRMMMMM